jgi:hypothetical protein
MKILVCLICPQYLQFRRLFGPSLESPSCRNLNRNIRLFSEFFHNLLQIGLSQKGPFFEFAHKMINVPPLRIMVRSSLLQILDSHRQFQPQWT